MTKLFIFFLILSVQTLASSHKVQVLTIPGAVCGRGKPYKVYFRPGDSTKLAIHLEGGGRCTNYEECISKNPLKRKTVFMSNMPEFGAKGIISQAVFSTNPNHSPIHDYSLLQFPYCTGDLFLGADQVEYVSKKKHKKKLSTIWAEKMFCSH